MSLGLGLDLRLVPKLFLLLGAGFPKLCLGLGLVPKVVVFSVGCLVT